MKRLCHGLYLAALCATMASGLQSQTLPASFPATGSTVMTVLSLITDGGNAWASVVSASPMAVVIRQSYGAVNISYRMVGIK